MIRDGVFYQSEDQYTNTAVLINSQCGGHYSEWFNCNGYILYNTPSTTSVKEQSGATPLEYKLYSAYPNPFNPTTTLTYQISKAGMVTIKIYDMLGREIETLLNGEKNPGKYEVKFDASDLVSGLYFYRIIANNFTDTKKMLLLR